MQSKMVLIIGYGDSWSDAEEKEAGTDPLDKLSFPLNSDE